MLEKLLFINACVESHDKSRTLELCHSYIDKFKKCHNDINYEEIKPDTLCLETMNRKRIDFRTEKSQQNDFSDEMFDLAKQFADADYIVVGAPYWDMSFPAVMKIYIENIMVTNLTFKYTETGAKGLCKAKKLVYITTSGGYIEDNNFGFEYISAIAGMLGVGNTQFVSAQGLDIWGNDAKEIIKKATDEMLKNENLF